MVWPFNVLTSPEAAAALHPHPAYRSNATAHCSLTKEEN